VSSFTANTTGMNAAALFTGRTAIPRARTWGLAQASGQNVRVTLAQAPQAGHRLRPVASYVNGAPEVQQLSPPARPGTIARSELPIDQYQRPAQAAASARRVTADEEFRGSLAIIIRGLAPLRRKVVIYDRLTRRGDGAGLEFGNVQCRVRHRCPRTGIRSSPPRSAAEDRSPRACGQSPERMCWLLHLRRSDS